MKCMGAGKNNKIRAMHRFLDLKSILGEDRTGQDKQARSWLSISGGGGGGTAERM